MRDVKRTASELLERRPGEKEKKLPESCRGMRTPIAADIFVKRWYIRPNDLISETYLRRNPLAAVNPWAILKGNRVYIFPRLIFDYYCCSSSIEVFKASVEELIMGQIRILLETQIMLWAQNAREVPQGYEDPQVSLIEGDVLWFLYTGVGKYEMSEEEKNRSVWAFAEFGSDLTVRRKGLFVCASREGKAGWSTNTVRLSQTECLVGWHSAFRKDLSYRTGLTIVDSEGELKAVSDYLLAPKGLWEEHGDWPLVIFGDGLLRYKRHVVWIGRGSVHCIGVFVAKLDKALNKLKKV